MRGDLCREYEVLWTGVNDGEDGDLLDVTLVVPIKRYPTGAVKPMRVLERPLYLAVLDILPRKRDEAIGYGDILARSGLVGRQVNAGLYGLRLRHLVASEALSGRKPRKGAPQKYWRPA